MLSLTLFIVLLFVGFILIQMCYFIDTRIVSNRARVSYTPEHIPSSDVDYILALFNLQEKGAVFINGFYKYKSINF